MTDSINSISDIAIVGGGVAGLSLALLLADKGLYVTLAEPYPPEPFKNITPSGRTVALMNDSIALLEECGVWKNISPLCCPIETMRIVDDSIEGKERTETEFSAYEIDLDIFGYNAPLPYVRATLYEKTEKHKNITIKTAALDNTDISEGYTTLTYNDGTSLRARLIIGADGKNSRVREQSGIEVTHKDEGQSAITALINHSYSHNDTATEFHRHGGPLAFVPMVGNQSAIVWVNETDRADALMNMSENYFMAALQEESRDILGGLTLETQPYSHPLSTMKAKSLTAPRVALIAEAAHAISPIAAQGLNLSLRDVRALADILTEAALNGLDIGSKTILDQYARQRRHDIALRVSGVDFMNKLVRNDNKALKTARRFGFQMTERLSPLKLFAMTAALAPYKQGA